MRQVQRGDTFGDKSGMDPRLLARAALTFRTGNVPFVLAPYHRAFNPLDPLTWYVKGAGYTPQRAPAITGYSPYFPA